MGGAVVVLPLILQTHAQHNTYNILLSQKEKPAFNTAI